MKFHASYDVEFPGSSKIEKIVDLPGCGVAAATAIWKGAVYEITNMYLYCKISERSRRKQSFFLQWGCTVSVVPVCLTGERVITIGEH